MNYQSLSPSNTSSPFRLNEAILWELREEGKLTKDFETSHQVYYSKHLEFPFVVIKRVSNFPLIFLAVRADQYPLLWVWWLFVSNIENLVTHIARRTLFVLWKFGIYKNHDCGSEFSLRSLFRNLLTEDSGFKYIDSLHYKCNLVKPWYKRILFWQP